MLRPRCGRKLKYQSSWKLSDIRRLWPWPHTVTTERSRRCQAELGRRFLPFEPLWRIWCRAACRRRANRAARRLSTGGRSSRASGPILVGHAVDLATGQPPLRTTARSKPMPPLAQHGLRQIRAPGSDSGRRRASDGHGGRPRRPPAIPAVRLPAHRPTISLRSDTADAGTNGHRTPDTGHLDAQTPAPDTGHDRVDRHAWTLTSDTGHRTPDEDADRAGEASTTAGIRTSWPPAERPRPGTPIMFLWAATSALGSPCGLGGETTCQGETAFRTTRQLLGRSAGEAAPRRTALLGRLRVERRANGEASSVMGKCI